MTLWHRRFGHQKLAQRKLVDGLQWDCIHWYWILWGMHWRKTPQVPKQQAVVQKNLSPQWHLWENELKVARRSGIFPNFYRQFVWVYVLKYKSDAFAQFKEWKALPPSLSIWQFHLHWDHSLTYCFKCTTIAKCDERGFLQHLDNNINWFLLLHMWLVAPESMIQLPAVLADSA